jgi:hypothetical protein
MGVRDNYLSSLHEAKKPPRHICLLAGNSLPDLSLVWKYRRSTTLTRLRGSPELGFLRPDCGVGLLDQPAAPGANLVPITSNQSGRTERAAKRHPMSSPHSNSPNAAGGSDG